MGATSTPQSRQRPSAAAPRMDRALAPDLARGAMLLLIALAHTAMVLFASVPGAAPEPQGAERAYNLFLFTFVHARALPLFALMFGYSIVQLALRRQAAGTSPGAVRGVLLRRNAWLFVFGLAHGVLLFSGDILGAYGIIGILLALLLVGRHDRWYRFAPWYLAFAGVYAVVLAVVVSWNIATGPAAGAPVPTSEVPSVAAPTYAASVLERLSEWPMTTLVLSSMILIAWVGAWAAHRRVLEEPARHLRMLRIGAVGGLGIGVAGGLPMGLLAAGWLDVDADATTWIKLLYEVSGTFGGIGYVSLFALVALAVSNRGAGSSFVVTAVTALGQRSLSGYLFQSVAWLALAAPFALALGSRVNSPALAAAGCAVGVWLLSVVGAYLMHRHGIRGPAEVLLRRLSYGRDWAARSTRT